MLLFFIMNVFLTGGTGFIGSYVVMELIKYGHNVTLLARDCDKIPAFTRINGLEIREGDISDKELLAELIKGKDACILIALNYTKQTAWEVLMDDTLPTVYMSDIAARAGVRHFIYTSSTAVNDSLYMGGEQPEEPVKTVDTATKQHPATFYGATKAASENFLIAQSYRSAMRINIIRPGYTFGNPVMEGAPTQADTRFHTFIKDALAGKPLFVIKNDGTQFIWAGDLARLYMEILHSNVNRKTYFGLSHKFIPWHAVAREAVKKCGSQSVIHLEDKGWSDDGVYWDVSGMQRDFGLEFDSWEKICGHLDYYIELEEGLLA